jgi:AcrR family transcriptional regulator
MTMDSEAHSPRRQPKGDKRDRTRAKLLEAARSLIREKGYEHTTLEDIAEKAGMTTGAIYGNFKNRDELYLIRTDLLGSHQAAGETWF